MLTLVIGRAGAGKSEYLYKKAAERTASGVRGAIFLVPETASHQAERQLCAYSGDAMSLSCEVLTFRRLANRVFSLYGGLAERTLDTAGRILIMHEAMESVGAQLSYYRQDAKESLLASLIGIIDEFKSSCITPEALAAVCESTDGALRAKLADLSLIYACYESLCGDTRIDERGILSLCAEKLKGSGFFDGRDVYIDGFSGFTPQELEILGNLSNARVTAAFTLDSLEEPEMIFGKTAKAAARLMTLVGNGHAEIVRLDPPERAAGLACLESQLFKFSSKTSSLDNNEVQFHYAGSIFSECEHIAAKVLELLRGGAKLRDITVAAGDFEAYRLPLIAAFERCALPYYINEKAQLEEKAAAALILRALDIASDGFSHRAVFSYLKTGLAGFTQDECSTIENYCLTWRVRPSQWTQRAPWAMHPDGFGLAFDDDARERLDYINSLRDRVRAPLMALSDAVNTDSAAREKLLALYDFAESIGLADSIDARAEELTGTAPEEGAQYSQLWDIFIGCIDQFDELAGDRRINAAGFCRVMQLMLASCDIGSIPPSIDRISVGPLSAAASQTSPYLFIAGAYDGAFPADAGSTGLLSDHDRDILTDSGVELGYTAEERESEALFTLYCALSSPRKTLFLSVPKCDASGAQLTPAFLMRRAALLLPDAPTSVRSEDAIYACAKTAFDYAFSSQSAEAISLRAVLQKWDGFEDTFVGLSDVYGGDGDTAFFDKPSSWKLDEKQNAGLFGENPYLSASRLESYNSCPFSYFANYGLSLNVRREAGFDAPATGSFIHYVLEGTVRDVQKAGGFPQCAIEDVKGFARQRIEDFVNSRIQDFDTKSARFKYLFMRLCRNIDFLVENLYEEFSKSLFEPLDFELQFSSDMPPVRVALDSGAHATLGGVADRVDGWVRDGILYLRVVDYKSGTKEFSYGEISAGLGLQLPVYLFALRANTRLYLKRHPELDADSIVPAGILYAPARLETVSAGRDMADSELQRELDKQLRTSGIVLDSEDVLEAMEPGIFDEGKGKYIPVKITKSGISGTVTDGQFEILGRYVRAALKATAELMQAGHYRPRPVQKGQYTSCRYCQFRALCGLDAQAHPETVKVIPSKKQDEFFAEAEKEE